MAAIPPDTWQPPNVYLETSMGVIVLELYWKHAPKTCKNFAELARRGYYNGTKFHRIIKDFMIQGGDPTGTGRGGASIYGKQFEDELHPDLKFTGAGILAMANAGPDTNGSQFFVTLAPTQWLDGKHTIFGRVCQGIGMVNRVGMVETNSQDRPVDDVKILKAYPSGQVGCCPQHSQAPGSWFPDDVGCCVILRHAYLLRSRGVVSGDVCILADSHRLEKRAALMSALAAHPLFTAPFSLQREFFQEYAQLTRSSL